MLFLLIFLLWTYAAPCHPAHFISSSFQCFLVILQALSLSGKITKLPSDSPGSRCQSHHSNLSLSLPGDSPGSLSLLPKSPNFLHNQITHATQLQLTLTCSSVVVTYFSRLPPLPGTLSIVYIWQIYHTAMGHRYFNLAMTGGICLRYAHASHKSAFAFRSPTPRDGHGTLT